LVFTDGLDGWESGWLVLDTKKGKLRLSHASFNYFGLHQPENLETKIYVFLRIPEHGSGFSKSYNSQAPSPKLTGTT